MMFIHVLLGPFYTSLLCFHWSPTILNIVFICHYVFVFYVYSVINEVVVLFFNIKIVEKIGML